ncbi:MAG: hypothetical protein IJC57_02410 [Clostridia bacterium]|nr:hypothetical protein [Clostridia bacterium]
MKLLENTAIELKNQLTGRKVDKLKKAEAIAILNAVLKAVKEDAEKHNDEINESSTLKTVVGELANCKDGQDISALWNKKGWLTRLGVAKLAPKYLSDATDKETVGTLITIMDKSL